MTTLRSTVDANATGYQGNRESMLAKLDALATEHAKALAGGGQKYVDRHHKRGKLLARLRRPCLDDHRPPLDRPCHIQRAPDREMRSAMIEHMKLPDRPGAVRGTASMLPE